MKYAALLVLLLLSACVSNDPASLEAQAAAMRRNTAEAFSVLDQEAQYTAVAQVSNATATQIASDLMLSSARATQEMSVAAQMAHAAELDGLKATATAQVVYTAMAYEPTRYAATATAQGWSDTVNTITDLGGQIGIALLILSFGILALIFVAKLGGHILNVIAAWADGHWANSKKHELIETTMGLMLLEPGTNTWRPVDVVDAESRPAASEVEHAPAAQVKAGPQMGELEFFVGAAISRIGANGTYIPRWDIMKTSAAAWSSHMDQLEALGFIPKRTPGKRSSLYANHTLGSLLSDVRNYEQHNRSKAPSLTGVHGQNGSQNS